MREYKDPLHQSIPASIRHTSRHAIFPSRVLLRRHPEPLPLPPAPPPPPLPPVSHKDIKQASMGALPDKPALGDKRSTLDDGYQATNSATAAATTDGRPAGACRQAVPRPPVAPVVADRGKSRKAPPAPPPVKDGAFAIQMALHWKHRRCDGRPATSASAAGTAVSASTAAPVERRRTLTFTTPATKGLPPKSSGKGSSGRRVSAKRTGNGSGTGRKPSAVTRRLFHLGPVVEKYDASDNATQVDHMSGGAPAKSGAAPAGTVVLAMAPVGCAWGATDGAGADPAAPVKPTTSAPVGPTKKSMATAGQASPVADRLTPASGRAPVDVRPDCAKRQRISASQPPQGLLPWPAPPPGLLPWPALPPLFAQQQTADSRAAWLLPWPAPMALPHAEPLPQCDPLLPWPALQQADNLGTGQQGTVADWPALPWAMPPSPTPTDAMQKAADAVGMARAAAAQAAAAAGAAVEAAVSVEAAAAAAAAAASMAGRAAGQVERDAIRFERVAADRAVDDSTVAADGDASAIAHAAAAAASRRVLSFLGGKNMGSAVGEARELRR